MAPPGARRGPPGRGGGPSAPPSTAAAAHHPGGPPPPAFVSHDATLARPTSIAHWQLRDLVACPSVEGELYVVRHCATLRHDIGTGKSTVVQALPFAPTSFCVGHGVIAAGGQHGQLDCRRLADGSSLIRGASGGSVNNALALAPGPAPGAGPLLYACNNDCTVRVFALPPPPPPPPPSEPGPQSRGGGGGGVAQRSSDGGGGTSGVTAPPSPSGREDGGGGGRWWCAEEEDADMDGGDDDAPGAASADENDGGAFNAADPTGWGAASSPRDFDGQAARLPPPPPSLGLRPATGRRRPSTAEAARAARARAAAPLTVVRCLDPVNYCAVGPAGAGGGDGAADGDGATPSTPASRWLATVGDCPAVTLHAPAEAGYVTSTVWNDVFEDAGMAVAWAPGGRLLAAAGQDGTVVALDPRAPRTPLARLRTRGAARALKFAPGPADLLAVTEHDSAVHIVDARTWGAAQVVRFGGADGAPRHVSGAAFAPGTGSKLYVGLEGAGIAQFSVDVAGRCCVAEWGAR